MALDLKVLQANVGYRCNLACKHCHVSGGPVRQEVMNEKIARQVIRVVTDNPFDMLDITGGAPEMNPSLRPIVQKRKRLKRAMTVRTNLTIFFEHGLRFFPNGPRAERGFDRFTPLLSGGQRRSSTRDGTYKKSIEALKILNGLGYGIDLTGPSLSLVYNPQACSSRLHNVRSKWNIVVNSRNASTSLSPGCIHSQICHLASFANIL